MKFISSPTAIKYIEEELIELEQQITNLDNTEGEEMSKKNVDIPTILTYIKYFVEHMKNLLIDTVIQY